MAPPDDPNIATVRIGDKGLSAVWVLRDMRAYAASRAVALSLATALTALCRSAAGETVARRCFR